MVVVAVQAGKHAVGRLMITHGRELFCHNFVTSADTTERYREGKIEHESYRGENEERARTTWERIDGTTRTRYATTLSGEGTSTCRIDWLVIVLLYFSPQ